MNKEYEAIGKNVDQAINNGLIAIGKNREDVDIKILETGGLFKKAKVILYYNVEEQVEKSTTPVVEDVKDEQPVIETTKIEEIKKVEDNLETLNEKTQEQNNEICTIETNVNTIVEDDVKENEPSIENNRVHEEKVIDTTNLEKRISDFLHELLNKLQIIAEISCQKSNNELHFEINGSEVGKLIGYRGETLNAIQYLLSNLKESGEGRVRVYLDVEGYKAKREETIIALANKMADKAEEIERNVHMDPMNAYERRIVHTALQDRSLVETESTGEGEKRHVVIKFKR